MKLFLFVVVFRIALVNFEPSKFSTPNRQTVKTRRKLSELRKTTSYLQFEGFILTQLLLPNSERFRKITSGYGS